METGKVHPTVREGTEPRGATGAAPGYDGDQASRKHCLALSYGYVICRKVLHLHGTRWTKWASDVSDYDKILSFLLITFQN